MGRVIGFELNSQQPDKSADFNLKVFVWKITERNWNYWAVTTGPDEKEGINGGIGKGPFDYQQGIRIQIEVDSIEKAISKATENDATVVR